MGSWNPKQLNPGSSASNQKSVKLQSHGAQICKGSSTCPKLLSYHAITSTTTHQLFHLTDTFTCSSSNFICCKCSKMYVGQAYKTLRDCFRHHRAAAKAKKRSWPLPLYMSRLFRDGGSSIEHCPPNRLCMLAKMPISRWGMCSSTSRNLMEDKHWGESGCQANQQQSCRFLKGLSAGKECAVPLPES